MLNFEWAMPTRVVFGPGSFAGLGSEVAARGVDRALVVTGVSAMAGAGVIDRARKALKGVDVRFHEGVRPNLPMDDCDELIGQVREFEPDVVIGIGGGSVLDGAKAAALIGPGEGLIADWLAGKGAGAGTPYIAVPTTAGTGSEVTPFMIILDAVNKKKLSLGTPAAAPTLALVDPELTVSLPPEQTAATGLDALSHALEAYWSTHATPISDALALEAARAVLDSILGAFQNPGDLEARTRLSYGSMTAGMALAQTATAAVHGLTYPMTAHYDVPHGIACAFLMREVAKINFHHLEPGKQARLINALNANNVGTAIDNLTVLYRQLAVPKTLDELNIPATEIERFADEATQKNLDRNVAPLDREKIIELWGKKVGKKQV